MSRESKELLAGLQPPILPDGLRQRVLSRARSASATRPALVDRLWESRPLRLAWVLSVVLLLGAHLTLAVGITAVASPSSKSTEASGLVVTEPGLTDLLARHPIREATSSFWLQSSRRLPG